MTYIRIQRVAAQILGAFLLTLVIAVPTVTTAQTRAQKSIITQLLWQSLLRCYVAPSERIGSSDEVVLRVELNTSGDIANLPDIISPATMSKGERGLLREATIAIIDCTPIISGGGEKSIYGRFDMVLNSEGMSLTNVDAFVGLANVIPTLDSPEVSPNDSVLVEITNSDNNRSDSDTVSPQTNSQIEEVSDEPAAFIPATLAIETELGLTRTDRLEIQRRLDMLAYNTRGIDGVFGPGSRTAIRQWQRYSDVPSTGS